MIKEGKLSHTEDSETPKFTNRLMLFQDDDWIIGNENVMPCQLIILIIL